MSRDRFTGRYESYEDDDWGEQGYTDARYDDASRALVTYDESRYLAIDDDEDFDEFDAELDEVPELLIIPGAGLDPRLVNKRRQRPLTMQLFIIAVAACVILGMLFSFTPLGAASSAAAFQPFTSLVNSLEWSKPQASFPYKARSGDSFEAMATRFGVKVGGIYLLNKLYAGDDAVVGTTYQIPTDSTLGTDYLAPFPPGLNPAGQGLLTTNYTGGCNFCSFGGKDNGVDGICAPGYALATSPLDYNLGQPDPGDGGSNISHFVRGFTAYHSGVDMSTGRLDIDPIVAAQDGVVIYADFDPGGGGWTIKINHCGGLATSYSHMTEGSFTVKVGDQVHKGQKIGVQGSTGDSSGAHLHYMTWWTNVPFDPFCAYPDNGLLPGFTNPAPYDGAYGGCPPNLYKGTAWWP